MTDAIISQCPACAATSGQKVWFNGQTHCSFCGVDYTRLGVVQTPVVAIKRAVSRKEEDEKFGATSMFFGCATLAFLWFVGAFITTIFSFLIGGIFFGANANVALAIGTCLPTVGMLLFLVATVYDGTKNKKQQTDGQAVESPVLTEPE